MKLVRVVLIAAALIMFQACAYRLGAPERRVPGGYRSLTIPIFENNTEEPGIEVDFTNSLIREFSRSQIARVTDYAKAGALLKGTITDMRLIPGSKKVPDETDNPYQPEGTVLAVDYRLILTTKISVVDRATERVVWTGSFSGERSYNASQVTLPGINSVNPNYNLSVKRRTIQTLAAEMMSEAFDRITENF